MSNSQWSYASVRLPRELHDAVRAEAALQSVERGRSVSQAEVIRDALVWWLNWEEGDGDETAALG